LLEEDLFIALLLLSDLLVADLDASAAAAEASAAFAAAEVHWVGEDILSAEIL
jgi:hypothetical protein